VDTQVKVVEMVVFVIEAVQSQAKFVGQVTVEIAAVCVLKAVGQEQVGVQRELHVDVVSQQITGVIQDTTDIVVLYVMHVITVGKTLHMVEILTEVV
tara:strand:- start:37 stop:327 length:291 start_codon:yes stop_codon:yes gene_type:complete